MAASKLKCISRLIARQTDKRQLGEKALGVNHCNKKGALRRLFYWLNITGLIHLYRAAGVLAKASAQQRLSAWLQWIGCG